jgi:hypothetical protein
MPPIAPVAISEPVQKEENDGDRQPALDNEQATVNPIFEAEGAERKPPLLSR